MLTLKRIFLICLCCLMFGCFQAHADDKQDLIDSCGVFSNYVYFTTFERFRVSKEKFFAEAMPKRLQDMDKELVKMGFLPFSKDEGFIEWNKVFVNHLYQIPQTYDAMIVIQIAEYERDASFAMCISN